MSGERRDAVGELATCKPGSGGRGRRYESLMVLLSSPVSADGACAVAEACSDPLPTEGCPTSTCNLLSHRSSRSFSFSLAAESKRWSDLPAVVDFNNLVYSFL